MRRIEPKDVEMSPEGRARVYGRLAASADAGELMEVGFQKFVKILKGSGIPVPSGAAESVLRAAFYCGGNHVVAAFELLGQGQSGGDDETSPENLARLSSLREEIDHYMYSVFRVRAEEASEGDKWSP